MPLRHAAQQKSVRQTERRSRRNISQKSETKTAIKKAILALGSDDASEKVKYAIKKLDKLQSHGVLHRKTVARRKSRLMKHFNTSQTSE